MNTQIAEALEKRELIKVSLLQNTDEVADEAALEIAQATNSEVVQVIGRVIVLYKASSKEKYQRLTQQLKLL
ncbi:ribosome assembly RNA-binding protein YhbY [Enterococcus cecorum]|nr:ribosome assembly RNA-binding protein YhbY [Enterococcus cecorum]CAI3312616.1 ribosome assembly RNA-binding protein YhbY [Enterococcus cecorum]CAI3326564.1 ribosome assembly RNA-binding protein YhbY [Enterococcus cecorum]CAI3356433.1 ribosome assembly RNA-binding protein YhbY [Enterococcus cecorum]CAI3451034.1 ribosome assembly RNA-binding protein YhbY [Enterococcus cecorum]